MMTGDSSETDKSSASDPPKVSVVTAAFNALDGVRATVESVASQSGVSVEHIVIDGGSSDGTVEYLSEPGSRAVWISEPDDGIADAMNKGVERARGEYVIVLQAGDTFIDEGIVARVVPFLERGPDIVSGNVRFADPVTGPTLKTRGFTFKTNFKTTILHQAAFCRRSLFERIGAFDTSYEVAMDYEFFLRAMRNGIRLETIDLSVAHMPDDGISSQLDWAALEKRFAEERRIHSRHCPGPGMRMIYAAYWPAYLIYRRLKALG
ncbi:MAG: glycosyltransferase [Rhodobacteraceae bacterium]|nr:glycosyltransferase [Paracoccaceae bacterium]